MTLPHQNLVAWQRADDLFIQIHRLTHQRLPRSEQYELGSQLRRAAHSVPSNIVEGIAREHARDKIRFFNISLASLRELGYSLHACVRLGYLEPASLAEFEQKMSYIAAPLHGLIRRERGKKARSSSVPR